MSFALLYFTVVTLFTPRHACLKEFRGDHIRLATVESINRDLATLKNAPLLERITRWSERFLGTPYGIDPAGEGTGRDQDPLFNTCAVDCETFVEQVLALSFSKNITETWR